MITLLKGSVHKSKILTQLASGLKTDKKIILDFTDELLMTDLINDFVIYPARGTTLRRILMSMKDNPELSAYHVFVYAHMPESDLDKTLTIVRKYGVHLKSIMLTVQNDLPPGHFELVELPLMEES